MRAISCNSCGNTVQIADTASLWQIDERSPDELAQLLLRGEPHIDCPECSQPSGAAPAIIVWIENQSRAFRFEGGPWYEDALAADWAEQPAEQMSVFNTVKALRAATVERCQDALARFAEATQHTEGEDAARWFLAHQDSLGPEIYAAALLSVDDLIGFHLSEPKGPRFSADAITQACSTVQCRACIAMCARWSDFRVNAGRLQDRIDKLLFAKTVQPAAAEWFGASVASNISGVPQHVGVAMEVTHAWLCRCAAIGNPRAATYTQAVFDLELLATMAGGDLPAVAHAMRLSADRLAMTLDQSALSDAIHRADCDGLDRAAIVETARRLDNADLASHLFVHKAPEWPKQLGNTAVGFVKGCDKPVLAMEWSKEHGFDVTNLLSSAVGMGDGGEDVFISYSSKDRIKAEAISRYLVAAGLSTFMDKHTAPGDLWTRSIPDALHTCAAVVVLWSRESLKSEWVLAEAKVALQRRVLFHALLDPVDPPGQFAPVQAANLAAWSADGNHPELSRLASEIGEKVGCGIEELPGTVDEVTAQLSRLEVAETVFRMCDAMAWHAIAPATDESLKPVGLAYERLKNALAPASHEDVHHLMEQFDLSRVLLLIAISSADIDTAEVGFVLPPPFVVTSNSRETRIDCTSVHTSRSYLVSALLDLPRARRQHGLSSNNDVFILDGKIIVEVVPGAGDTATVGYVLLRRS